ncbi:LytTR family transcriptional regulator [Methylovirgula ligni]|uniref:Putative membrane protein (TIGR02226 family) n=1 Tax=Methylovirgula ligni TaxID=569860 RepID=A0A3D9YU58_9HYPH|nr:DUF4159 domain-containing protein [Methylovirgula ligni]QAY96180.1 LytTR family transcriptional regulator [Methylovirgula ligni]REF86126.1 putative membrane protein (TIGR02226 family) [Methylovirgula ligni]
MLGLPLAFAFPLVLAALAGLPVLYYLLRVTPPHPQRVPFPPLRLILDLRPQDETAARTPWWLLALRLAIAAAIILAMAGPVLNPLPAGAGGKAPLLIVLDDGWAAAPNWEVRQAAAEERIEAAARRSQLVGLVAASDGGREISLTDATHALERLRAIKPLPYISDRVALVAPIAKLLGAAPKTDIVWIADGLSRGHAREFAEKLAALAPHIALVTGAPSVRGLAGPENRSDRLQVRVLRATADGPVQGIVRALDLKSLAIGETRFEFSKGALETKASFDLPVDLRNDIARLEILDQHSTGAVSLLDARWKRRTVGIVSDETADVSLPLLAPNYYLHKALAPFADVREARPGTPDPIAVLLDQHPAVLILADVGTVSDADHALLTQFVEEGGLLLRFAGARLAAASDDLVPVRLRRGGRVLGSALSWETPKRLAPFDAQSPFVGLKVPGEVTVRRQVLAEPDADVPGKTWAHLVDGTPLVTAAPDGKGMIVLFHVTADTTWSNLPLSGLFVDMLHKIVDLSTALAKPTGGSGGEAQKSAVVPPTSILDGFGVLGAPPPTAKPVPVNFVGAGTAEHPPGFYGPPDQLLSVNALGPNDDLRAADFSGLGFAQEALRRPVPTDLRPALLAVAFLLFIVDALASLWLSGGFPRRFGRAAAALALIGLAASFTPGHVKAAPRSDAPLSQSDLQSALNTRLAYIISGDPDVDAESKGGLTTLSQVLAQRTSLIPGAPVGVDPARDELAFYPMIYWPIVAGQPQPSPAAIARIAAYMRQGGTIVFDTRDALTAHPEGPPTPEALWLRQLLHGVDVPPLEPIPPDHVVTKTFYLIDGFVGRYENGQTWIESLPPPNPADGARPARASDSVSPILITSNDLAAGWAADENGDSLYALMPGGARQHELALRGGVNLVMYTLTGNYKSDQVHVRDLLERLAH